MPLPLCLSHNTHAPTHPAPDIYTHAPPHTHLCPPPAELAAQEAARREAYLQLVLPPGGVLLWADDEPACDTARQLLGGSDALGLDVEWKPSHVTTPAALLQVWVGKCCGTLLFAATALPWFPTHSAVQPGLDIWFVCVQAAACAWRTCL